MRFNAMNMTISIHALLAESDGKVVHIRQNDRISIHALLAESDYAMSGNGNALINFYPRSPCGERQRHRHPGIAQCTISIHALLAESDRTGVPQRVVVSTFLSTLSLRRATPERRSGACIPDYFYPRSPCGERLQLAAHANASSVISIHALLAESDLRAEGPNKARYIFLSTLSLRRATGALTI